MKFWKKTPTKAETLHRLELETLEKAWPLLMKCSDVDENEHWFECAGLSGEILGLLDAEEEHRHEQECR